MGFLGRLRGSFHRAKASTIIQGYFYALNDTLFLGDHGLEDSNSFAQAMVYSVVYDNTNVLNNYLKYNPSILAMMATYNTIEMLSTDSQLRASINNPENVINILRVMTLKISQETNDLILTPNEKSIKEQLLLELKSGHVEGLSQIVN